MIRPAKFSDAPAMATMLVASHQRSKYAGRCGVSEKAAEEILCALVAGQNATGLAATFVEVVEDDNGSVTGFMAGATSRIYNIGDRYCASDIFLINENKNLKETLKLIDDYIAWARSNPKVIEVGLSWSDALPNASDIANIYSRKGATKVGEQFSIRIDLQEAEAA